MVAIFWMSSRTSLGFEQRFPVPRGPLGNFAHVALFGCLGFLFARALDPAGASAGIGARAGKLAILFTALYGLSDEIHQFFTPGRTSSFYDVVLDTLGAVTALLLPRPSGPGRPAGWRRALACFGIAAGLAIVTGIVRPLPDRVLEELLRALGFGRG